MPHEYANGSEWTQGKTDMARRLKYMFLLPREMHFECISAFLMEISRAQAENLGERE